MRKMGILSLTIVALMVINLSIGISAAKESKVQVCHNGHTIDISDSALAVHLANGDTEGACAPPAPSPELSTTVLTSAGIVGLVGFSKLKTKF